jgi:GNAT superfamily N-acetyltransferase
VLEVRTVSSRRELDEWIALTDRLYAGTPQFVPPLRQQLRDFHARKAPYFRHGDIELLGVVRDGEVVARTTAHTNAKLDAKLGARRLLFGFTEFVDDDAVFAELVGALEERARGRGAMRLFGPVNLLPNQSGGVVISGYEERGFVDSPYNHPYYPAVYERHGFERRFEGETFVLDRLDRDELPIEKLFAFDAERIERERLEVRHADRKRMAEELVFVREMLNASFAQLGYYTEIDEDEFAYQVAGLGHLIDERIALYLFKDGRPIGFVLCVPDISEFVRSVNGNLNLPNQLRLLLTRGRYRSEAIAVIQGILPEEQGQGYLRLLWGEFLRNLRNAGYHTLRGTFVEHRNVASSAYANRLGKPAHGICFYERAVT